MSRGSVWSWDRLEYDYYEVPGHASVGGWGPGMRGLGLSARGQGSGLGMDVEASLPPLPAGSRPVGRGPDAQGTIYRLASAPAVRGLSGSESSGFAAVAVPLIIVVLGLGALLASASGESRR